jgi:ribosome-associated protein
MNRNIGCGRARTNVVVIMNLRISGSLTIPESELRLSFARSSGPGGQNVNKVSSKAILHFDVQSSPSLPDDVRARFLERYSSRITKSGEVVIHSEEFRDQPKNIQACHDKLRDLVLSVLKAPKKRRPTKPSRGSKVRRLKDKKARSQIKQGRQFRDE